MIHFVQYRSRQMIAIAMSVLPFSTAADLSANDAAVRKKLETAISAYQQALTESNPDSRKASFQKSEIAFSSLLADESLDFSFSPDTYVNWGNAAIQIGKTGVAVFAYRKALSKDSFQTRARKNLDFVRSKLPDWTKNPKNNTMSFQHLLFWNQQYSKPTLRIFLAGLFLLGCLLIFYSYCSRQTWVKNLCVVPFAMWAIVLLSQFYDSSSRDVDSVVFVQDETLAYSADSSNSPTSFASAIPAGTEAVALESRDNWTHIRFGDNRQGWVQNSSIRWILQPDDPDH